MSFWYDNHYQDDGFTTGGKSSSWTPETWRSKNRIMADTEPDLHGPDGWVYYFNIQRRYGVVRFEPGRRGTWIGLDKIFNLNKLIIMPKARSHR
jgi:hypothetical protein